MADAWSEESSEEKKPLPGRGESEDLVECWEELAHSDVEEPVKGTEPKWTWRTEAAEFVPASGRKPSSDEDSWVAVVAAQNSVIAMLCCMREVMENQFQQFECRLEQALARLPSSERQEEVLQLGVRRVVEAEVQTELGAGTGEPAIHRDIEEEEKVERDHDDEEYRAHQLRVAEVSRAVVHRMLGHELRTELETSMMVQWGAVCTKVLRLLMPETQDVVLAKAAARAVLEEERFLSGEAALNRRLFNLFDDENATHDYAEHLAGLAMESMDRKWGDFVQLVA